MKLYSHNIVFGLVSIGAVSNLALIKPAKQSSTHTWDGVTYSAKFAVDGNNGTHLYEDKCTHTAGGDTNPWWLVDLEAVYFIKSVRIFNRGMDKGGIDTSDRLRDITVTVGLTESDVNTPCGVFAGPGTLSQLVVDIDCSSVPKGRFVKISKTTEYLTLCEVEVFGSESLPVSNLALIKPAKQSSTHTWDGVTYSAKFAVDGNNGTHLYEDKCTHTAGGDTNPWWLVDLEAVYFIKSVRIFNRGLDKGGIDTSDRLRDITVTVGLTESDVNTPCGVFAGPGTLSQLVVDIDCSSVPKGRFVKISKTTEYLTLCEVEVFGSESLPVSNLALIKPAKQSSTHTWDGVTYSAKFAVDGNNGTHLYEDKCTHTAGGDTNPWWLVDLESVYFIKSVRIFNRGMDKGGIDTSDRLRDINVTVGLTESDVNTPCGVFAGPGTLSQLVVDIDCSSVPKGRFVKISKKTEYLTLCEVEVFGYSA